MMPKRLQVLFTVLVMAIAAPVAQAEDFQVGDIVIERPWTRATPGRASRGVGYATLINGGVTDDRLKSATSPIAQRVEIHTTMLDGGIMRMRRLENGIALPAQAIVRLQPGGMHLMLIGLKKPIEEGDDIPVTLRFEKSGDVKVLLDAAGIGARNPVGIRAPAAAGGSRSGAAVRGSHAN